MKKFKLRESIVELRYQFRQRQTKEAIKIHPEGFTLKEKS